jgi:hypothetical protein
MQNVECGQPHGKKVAIIGTIDFAGQDAEPVVGDREALRAALKQAASALKAAGVPFALGGSYALWVHGGPEGEHDVDIVVPEERTEVAADCLEAAGLRVERPPEDWLFKAYWQGAMVDVLHRLGGHPVAEELVTQAEEYQVLGLWIPVLPVTEVIVYKLLALSEHYADFGALLPHVRAVREQIDWDRIRRDTADHAFSEAFLVLADRLGITPNSSG